MKILIHKLLLLTTLLIINSTQVKCQNINITGPAGSGIFGESVTVLTNGNYVITDPSYSEGIMENVGAVYLYNGSTHTLISTLKGTTKLDFAFAKVTALPNGNYVVSSPNWDDGAIINVGAVTWCNGTTGLPSKVNSGNSLIGNIAESQVGSSGITVLNNGNYVVRSPLWNDGSSTKIGAVTWCNGSTGTTGVVSSSNSIVGSQADDNIGGKKVITLNNGNYVVVSPDWDAGGYINAGAVTWGNGTTGTSGVISSSNSLTGISTNDQIGSSGITTLINGNYVVKSPNFIRAGKVAAGAATWCSGATGKTGVVSSSNSLVGSEPFERTGQDITALSNGNYVVRTVNYKIGTIPNVGAVTWSNGTTGITGNVNSGNSLIGSRTGDYVGASIIALSNGNYVVGSPQWGNGTASRAGAVTWGNGTTGIIGTVSSTNSLVGSTLNDKIGDLGILALTNGNYVVSSPSWDNGTIADVGAVTWGNGNTGISGLIHNGVFNSNSLVGSRAGDGVGTKITALSNGNYVVGSQFWDKGTAVNAGAATWCDGSSGTTGKVTTSNSIVGSHPNDEVGTKIIALSNGNYVVQSPKWDNGTIENAGATTWGVGTRSAIGEVSINNSLVGTSTNDQVGTQTLPLSNGNYVVGSGLWDNGAIVNAGAVTWGNGSTSAHGVVSISNSLVGSSTNDYIGDFGLRFINEQNYYYEYFTALSNGNYMLQSESWDNGALVDAGALTLGNGSSGISGVLTTCNSVFGTSTINYSFPRKSAYNSVYNYILAGRPLDNIVTIFNPTALSLATSLDAATVTISGNNPVPLVANAGCRIIATLTPTGSSTPVNGVVEAKVWIEASVPTYSMQPFVARHYQITPAANASTAQGNVTLYFTQQEFDDFNAVAGSILDLPSSAGDVAGKANLRIGKYAGISNDGTGLPGTYSDGATVIDPADGDIIWNAALSRWEVSFDVTGFSGFIVQTKNVVLPLTLLAFNGRLQNNNAVLNWKTDNEQNTAHFEIERSIDGSHYSSVGNVTAANTAGTHQYGFTNNNISTLSASVVYYRLKQVDIDGGFVYSKVIALSPENKNIVFLYPNPVVNEVNLSIRLTKSQQVQLRIIDNVGSVVKQQQFTFTAGNNSLSINLSSLAKGLYYVELKGESLNERKRFVKQ